jgi:uncharacterized protein
MSSTNASPPSASAAASVVQVPIDLRRLADRLGLPESGVAAVIALLDAGNTVPFISRYRRDQTGGLDELAVRRIAQEITRARQLADRKQTVLRSIENQGKLTAELTAGVLAAQTGKELEDIYLPFKPKKLSLAEIARQRRLEPLAREILAAAPSALDLDRRAADFVDADGQVATAADALLGVGHIIADEVAARAEVRQRLRTILEKSGQLRSQRLEAEGKPISKDAKHYRDYFDYAEHVQRIPPHRGLAINRGERAKILRVRVEGPAEEMQAAVEELVVPEGHPHADFLKGCVRDAISRLILPSLERELRREITEQCEQHAVEVFARNLRHLILQPPVAGKRVLAVDPAFKSGCKVVVVDPYGNPLEHDVLHIIGKSDNREEAATKLTALVEKHGVQVIAIGNGAAGREAEGFVADLVAGPLADRGLEYVVVNEAGASVYSTSALAREEFPQHDASIRSAISIGRRLQDPLSELVKIEPANIGVGLYQHDVRAKHLHASLDAVVESCVNYVGVDVNTASPALLRYVSGLNQAIARGIAEWRATKGAFQSRQQLREVPGFGEATYVQAAGFLKIGDGTNPLDATWIHPESYAVAERVLERLGASVNDLSGRERTEKLAQALAKIDLDQLAQEFEVGRLLLDDIVEQLARPGRDPREDLPRPFFKKGVLKLEDLELGMELMGSVLNVVDFGAFVDIGLHDSGLVHISQLSRKFVRDPHDLLTVGQVVKVWVLELDKNRRRVALTMIPPGQPQQPSGRGRGDRRRGDSQPAEGQQGDRRERRPSGQREDRGRGGSPRGSQPRGPRGRRDGGRPEAGRGRPALIESRKPRVPAPPITEAMREGREPLRTFGDLFQFVKQQEEPEAVPEKKKRRRRSKKKPSQLDGESSTAAAANLPGDALAPPSAESSVSTETLDTLGQPGGSDSARVTASPTAESPVLAPDQPSDRQGDQKEASPEA